MRQSLLCELPFAHDHVVRQTTVLDLVLQRCQERVDKAKRRNVWLRLKLLVDVGESLRSQSDQQLPASRCERYRCRRTLTNSARLTISPTVDPLKKNMNLGRRIVSLYAPSLSIRLAEKKAHPVEDPLETLCERPTNTSELNMDAILEASLPIHFSTVPPGGATPPKLNSTASPGRKRYEGGGLRL